MCSKIDPLVCHRAILCAKNIEKENLEVTHIIAKRSVEIILESQTEFNVRLLRETKVNNLEQAYQIQNKKIGYKLTN